MKKLQFLMATTIAASLSAAARRARRVAQLSTIHLPHPVLHLLRH